MPDDGKENFLKEVLTFGAIALVIVLPIRLFIAQPFVVSGASMEPTFHDGEYLIVDEATFHFEDPKRGDVLIFKYPKEPSKYFIKRLVGLPGETVHIGQDSVRITDTEGNEQTLDESYVVHRGNGDTEDVTVPKDQYFVMGDNRPGSSDSRTWGFLPKENVVGRAFLRLLPITRIGIFPGALDEQK